MQAFLEHHQHVRGYLLEGLRASIWLVLLTAVFVPLEWLFAVHPKNILRKSVLRDIGFYFISNFLPSFVLMLPLAAASYVAYTFVPASWHETVESWPLWVRGLAAFVVADLGFYWGHRLAHTLPVMWRFHAVHHAPEHVYFLISARAHPVDNAFIRVCGLVPIYILGLGAPQSVQGTLVATLLMLAVTFWGFFIHANVRWRFGPLEWLLATPAFHLWHHTATEPQNRNFASMLPVWDRLFGTHYLPRGQWPAAYGIREPIPETITGQLLHPFLPPMKPRSEPAPQPSAPSAG